MTLTNETPSWDLVASKVLFSAEAAEGLKEERGFPLGGKQGPGMECDGCLTTSSKHLIAAIPEFP